MILMRHAETVFNVTFGGMRIDPGVADPALTPAGRAQAAAAADALRAENVRRVVASPYARALETAHIVAGALDLPVAVEPLVRERAAFACDIGTPRSRIAARWRALSLDHLDEIWWSQGEERPDAFEARCRAFRAAMTAAPDWPHVLVVTHWGVIRGLTGRTVGNGQTLRFDPTGADSDPGGT